MNIRLVARKPFSLIIVTAASLGVTACGGGIQRSSGNSGQAQTLAISASSPASEAASLLPLTPPVRTPRESNAITALKQLEVDGKIPIFDRGNDLAGPDTDANGVRDDIDRLIDHMDDTVAQKQSLRQLASSFRSILVTDPAQIKYLTYSYGKVINAVTCVSRQYQNTKSNQRLQLIEASMFNTKQRFVQYEKFNKALDKTTASLPEGEVCE